MEVKTSSLLESFDDMNLEDMKKDLIVLVPQRDEEPFELDPENCPFKAIAEAEHKITLKVTSSSSFSLKIEDFKLKEQEYEQEIINIQVLRYQNSTTIFMTGKIDRPAVCLEAQRITHEQSDFFQDEGSSEYNVSVLMGDRTQSTNLEILARNIIEFINTTGKPEVAKDLDPDDINSFPGMPMSGHTLVPSYQNVTLLGLHTRFPINSANLNCKPYSLV